MARPEEGEGNSTTDNKKQAKQFDGGLDVRRGTKIQKDRAIPSRADR